MEKIIVADSDIRYLKSVSETLNRAGYKVFQASDCAGVLRLAHSIHPEVLILDAKLNGMDAFEVGEIVEREELSTVIYMTNYPDDIFFKKINEMKFGVYIQKPIKISQLYGTIKLAINNRKQINAMKKKIAQLEKKLESEKLISQAKLKIMIDRKIDEEKAYEWIRKKSMDTCRSIEETAVEIVGKIK